MNSTESELTKTMFVGADITDTDGVMTHKYIAAVVTTPLYSQMKPHMWILTEADYKGQSQLLIRDDRNEQKTN